MDFNLSEDQQAFAQTARQFAESELAPHAARPVAQQARGDRARYR